MDTIAKQMQMYMNDRLVQRQKKLSKIERDFNNDKLSNVLTYENLNKKEMWLLK